MKARAAWLAIPLLGALGCGQKGPLYLPDHTGAVVTRPAAGAQATGTPAQSPGAAQQPAATQQPGAAQQPGATQQPGAAQQPAATQQPPPPSATGTAPAAAPDSAAPASSPNAPGTGAHKGSGKDDDATQK